MGSFFVLRHHVLCGHVCVHCLLAYIGPVEVGPRACTEFIFLHLERYGDTSAGCVVFWPEKTVTLFVLEDMANCRIQVRRLKGGVRPLGAGFSFFFFFFFFFCVFFSFVFVFWFCFLIFVYFLDFHFF